MLLRPLFNAHFILSCFSTNSSALMNFTIVWYSFLEGRCLFYSSLYCLQNQNSTLTIYWSQWTEYIWQSTSIICFMRLFQSQTINIFGAEAETFCFCNTIKMKSVKILQSHLPVGFTFKKLFHLQKLVWMSQHPISAGYNGLKKKKVHGLFHGLRVSQTWVWIPSPLSTGYEILEKFFNFSKSCIFLILRLTINFTELLGGNIHPYIWIYGCKDIWYIFDTEYKWRFPFPSCSLGNRALDGLKDCPKPHSWQRIKNSNKTRSGIKASWI